MDSADLNTVDRVEFLSCGSTLESWIQTFPDPSNSPACYTRSLHLWGFEVVATAISDARPSVHSFNNTVDLQVETMGPDDLRISFTQLHGLSPTLKSLDLSCSYPPLSEVLNFVCSFPLLEELSLFSVELGRRPTSGMISHPYRNSPDPHSLSGGNRDVTRKLLLPDCLRLSKIRVLSPIEYADLTNELVSLCSDTLESLCISFHHCVFSTVLVVDQDPIATYSFRHV